MDEDDEDDGGALRAVPDREGRSDAMEDVKRERPSREGAAGGAEPAAAARWSTCRRSSRKSARVQRRQRPVSTVLPAANNTAILPWSKHCEAENNKEAQGADEQEGEREGRRGVSLRANQELNVGLIG